MDWKYVVATTFIEMVQIMQLEMARSCAATASNAVLPPSTNSRASQWGNGGTTCTAQANTHNAVVIQKPRTSVSRTRLKFRATQLYPNIGCNPCCAPNTGMNTRIITLWNTPSDAICIVADAESFAQNANATANERFISAPITCWRNGARPIPIAFAMRPRWKPMRRSLKRTALRPDR